MVGQGALTGPRQGDAGPFSTAAARSSLTARTHADGASRGPGLFFFSFQWAGVPDAGVPDMEFWVRIRSVGWADYSGNLLARAWPRLGRKAASIAFSPKFCQLDTGRSERRRHHNLISGMIPFRRGAARWLGAMRARVTMNTICPKGT